MSGLLRCAGVTSCGPADVGISRILPWEGREGDPREGFLDVHVQCSVLESRGAGDGWLGDNKVVMGARRAIEWRDAGRQYLVGWRREASDVSGSLVLTVLVAWLLPPKQAGEYIENLSPQRQICPRGACSYKSSPTVNLPSIYALIQASAIQTRYTISKEASLAVRPDVDTFLRQEIRTGGQEIRMGPRLPARPARQMWLLPLTSCCHVASHSMRAEPVHCAACAIH